MVIRKSDLTAYAQELGMWETLVNMAGIPLSEDDNDDLEIRITRAEVNKN
jgi:hypothetical protein